MRLVSELGQYRLQSQAVNTITFGLCIKTLQTGIGINITHLTSTFVLQILLHSFRNYQVHYDFVNHPK